MRASWTACSTPPSRGCSQQELTRPSVCSRTRHHRPCCPLLHGLDVSCSVCHHKLGAIDAYTKESLHKTRTRGVNSTWQHLKS